MSDGHLKTLVCVPFSRHWALHLLVLLLGLLLTAPSFVLSWEALLLFARLQKVHSFSLPLLSIILTAARSLLEACCSIFWQRTFLLLLYCLSVHYHTALVISIPLQALLCYPICILEIFWWQWSIFMAVLMSSHCCLSLISWGRAYRKMNYTTQRTGWMFCSQLEANLPRQDLAGASN